MKKVPILAIPLLFALLTLVLFMLLYRPAPGSPEMTSAFLVFFTALSWSALTILDRKKMQGLKFAYAAAALFASVLLTEIFRPFPVDPMPHRLMVSLQVLGMAGIVFYLNILKRKREGDHD